MPIPRWRQNNIAPVHCDALTVDGCKAALTFDDKPHCEGGVAMRRCSLIRHNELEASVEGVGCTWRRLISISFVYLERCKAFPCRSRINLPRAGLMSMRTLLSACF